MKKFLIATAALAVSSPTLADANLVYQLDADVAEICGVYKFDGPTVPVNFGELSATPTTTTVNVGAGSASYRCNAPEGFTRTISSANLGKLKRDGAASANAENSIAFTITHGGGSGLGFAATSLSTNKVDTFNGSPAFLAGQTGSVSFQVNGVNNTTTANNGAPGTTVFASNYTDIVTIAVTGN